MIKIVLVLKNIHAAFDRIFLKNVVNLFQIALSIFPDEDDRNSFERIDKGKEETMNEIVMMRLKNNKFCQSLKRKFRNNKPNRH